MNKETQQVSDRDFQDFYGAMSPFGSRDIGTAIQTAFNAGKDVDYLADAIEAWEEETNTDRGNVDVCYVIYSALFQEARNDIEQATGIDIFNDFYSLYIHGNYMCTQFDGREEDYKELRKVIEEIPEEDRTEVVEWLYSELER